jgi:uncharacterized heparinase superfamily protein
MVQRSNRPNLLLVTELIAAAWRRAMAPLRIACRRTWIYRLLLRGRMPDRITVQPHDFTPARLEDADALLRGRFRFHGETIEVKEGSVFDQPPPSRAWEESLHRFAWLPPLALAGGDSARSLASSLITQWLRRHRRYSEPAWCPDVLGRRLIHLFTHGRFVLANSDVLWRSKLLLSLREQSSLLARISAEAPEGLPRLEAAAAHAISGVCLNDHSDRLTSGLERFAAELARQILSDGGHVSRSPEALLQAYRLLAIVSDALGSAGVPLILELCAARDRMAPMVRFFRLGDGALAMFNGGREDDAKAIADLLARDEVRGQPFAFAPDSGYQRLAAGRTLLVMDCGVPPEGAFANAAHAGCLSFEFSAGNQRVVVNCGISHDQPRWNTALRVTAAHSTVTLGERSMASVMSGRLANLLGPRLLGGPRTIQSNRQETQHGWTVEASHDGYASTFGVLHQRRLTLSPNGRLISGDDRLIPQTPARTRDGLAFAARFHVHPDVRVSANQGGGALLKLTSGEGWRFQCAGAQTSIEESVYLSNETLRRCQQLVVRGALHQQPVALQWAFERIPSA